MMRAYNKLIIGEDTGTHQNDVIWLYELAVRSYSGMAFPQYSFSLWDAAEYFLSRFWLFLNKSDLSDAPTQALSQYLLIVICAWKSECPFAKW